MVSASSGCSALHEGGHLGEARRLRGGCRRQGECRKGLERAVRFPRGREQRLRELGRRAADAGHLGRVLAIEGRAQARRLGGAAAVTGGERRDKRRRAQVDRKLLDPHLCERLRREQHRLGIRLGRGRADELGAHLEELPLGPQLAALYAQDLARIGEPQRPRRGGKARRGQARHLRRHVGAHAHHALAHRVHEAEGVGGRRGTQARKQAVLELDKRRIDALVAVRRERRHEALAQARLVRRLGRQEVAQSRRQKRLCPHLAHAVPLVLRLCHPESQH